jgi:hypothetical protein
MKHTIFTAIRESNVEVFEILKEDTLELRDEKNSTPLMCACSNGKVEFVCDSLILVIILVLIKN